MSIRLFEQQLECPIVPGHRGLLSHLHEHCEHQAIGGLAPVRFVVTETTPSEYRCEIGCFSDAREAERIGHRSIFEFRRRAVENTRQFSVVLLVPTGIGAEIGGHAGDAGPVASMLAEVCDTLVLHPNVVNASDLNEMPENSLYVEGSVVTRLLMGTVGLQRARSNRVLVVVDDHRDELFVSAAVNAISGGRAAYGLSCREVVRLDPPVKLRAGYSPSGRAAGQVEELEGLCRTLEDRIGEYDAVAVSSVIELPAELHQGYFDAAGTMVNPWGGVEAMLTHALSSVFEVPTAHSPMFESRKIANMDPGVVDPRMAAEAVSLTFLQCILKGLQRSPRIITDEKAIDHPGVFSAADVSCVVVPDGCLGLPVLAALEQGIALIAVRENRNLMKNDLASLPWAPGQFHQVANYWEAVGVIAALRAGIEPASVRRPLLNTTVSRVTASHSEEGGKGSSLSISIG